MYMERKIRLIAGTFILASLGMGWWVSPYWFLFTALRGGQPLPVPHNQVVPHGRHSAMDRDPPGERVLIGMTHRPTRARHSFLEICV